MKADSVFTASAMPDPDWWGALWPDPEGVLRRLGVDFGQSVLDLCCGDGHFTVPLLHIVGRVGRVMALDIDPNMLNRAKARARKCAGGENAGAEAIDWIEADALKLAGHLPRVPDFILIANTFHGVPDKPALLAEAYAALMPGGQLAVINWHHRPREETTVLNQPRGPQTNMRLTPDQVAEEATKVGFRLHGVIDLPPYHYAVVFDKAKAK